MNRVARFILKHATAVAILGTLLAFVGAYFSARLYMNLRPDFEELLPETTRSVVDFNEVANRLSSVESIVVLIFSKNTEKSKQFAEALGKRLEKVNKDIISLSSYRLGPEFKFFEDHQLLFVDLKDLERVRKYIKKRISWEASREFSILPRADLRTKPTFDFEELKKSYQHRTSDYGRFTNGFYSTPDRKVRAVVAYMPGKGLTLATKMKAELERAIAEVNPKSYSSDIEIKFTGNAENLIEESAALVADLELSTVIVMLLVTFFMWVFYRSVRGTLALVGSIFMGTFWTFGVCYFIVHYLNANTAFLASIVVGNGINFGIIFLARYLEERRRGDTNLVALETTMVKTAPATIVAALASGLSYGSLMLTEFRGFNQFGVIGLVGMLLCWVSAYTLLPAYLMMIDRFSGDNWIAPAPKPIITGPLVRLIERFPGPLCGFFGIAVVLSVVSLFRYNPDTIIETELSKLKDKQCIQHGSEFLYHYIDDIFGHSFSPVAIMPPTRAQTRLLSKRMEERQKKDGSKNVITTIQSLDDFIPDRQPEKIALINEIKKLLKPGVVNKMTGEDHKSARKFLDTPPMQPFGEKELPSLIIKRFTEKNGSYGKLVMVDKKIEQMEKDDSASIVYFVETVRKVTDSVAPGAPVAGSLPLVYDMLQTIKHDGPKATLFAFLAVVILVILLFRHVKTIVLCLFALGLGVLWLGGIILGSGMKINFLNFIALPITFGIGVDYGVNIFQRFRQEKSANLVNVIRHTGGAVMHCSLSTIIGYSSLLIAGNQAFVSFGTLAVLGEITCVSAAVIALPALLRWRNRLKSEEELELGENTKLAI